MACAHGKYQVVVDRHVPSEPQDEVVQRWDPERGHEVAQDPQGQMGSGGQRWVPPHPGSGESQANGLSMEGVS